MKLFYIPVLHICIHALNLAYRNCKHNKITDNGTNMDEFL